MAKEDPNAQVIAEFRANGGIVASPYDNPPPMLLIHTKGRKSGQDHITPMRCLVDGNDMYVFATAHGSKKEPDWYLNLLANPVIEVELGTETRTYRARPLEGAERERIWNLRVAQFPQTLDLQDQARRLIPVVRLDSA
jgi:deazaflavin-dependent oxidoreductase (nitroreductase family)